MERSPIFLIEPVPGIKRQELDLGSLGQIGRLVNDESPGLHSSLQSHAITVAPRPLLHKVYPVRADGKPGGRAGRVRTNRREHSRRPNRRDEHWSGHVRRMRVTGCSRIATQLLPESKEGRKHSEIVALTLGSGPRGHRREFLDSAPAVILGAAAARTQHIRLTSAVTVLSAEDPVRAFQNFATLDLLSRGRAEMIVGRGSSIEAFPLFGFRLEDYDALFAEKLDLLLNIRAHEHVHWSGQYRPALTGQGVYPRPVQTPLPIWLGVGGTPQSFVRAGQLGLPLMVAIIGGEPRRFRPLIDLYRETGM
jgi:alkanesulfonate monooxygenase SsuD/methylene tetrahydromethanopterin reductase-like flavin-dependent oxidoreductase (luciferase family)